MHLPKRIELWVLLAMIVAGLVWVFLSRDDGEDDMPGGGTTSVADDQAPLKLHRCTLKRDYGNARLDIELRVRNDGAGKLVMQSPKVKLLTGKGREVPSFFLPFDAVPEVAAKSAQDVQLRYWLETADLRESLTLEVDGKTMPVKSAKAFDIEAMKNGEERVMQPGEW
jgi:hypothetical protein